MGKKIRIIIFAISILLITMVSLLLFSYLVFLPKIISSSYFFEYVQKSVKEFCNADFTIHKPVLNTSLKPKIQIIAENIFLSKNGETIFNAQNLNCEIDFTQIFSKKIILKELGADDLYIDINKLQTMKMKEPQETASSSDFVFDWLNSFLYIKRCAVIYGSPKGVIVKFLAKDINLVQKNKKNFLHFKILVDTDYQKERLRILLADKDNVYIQNNQLCFDNFKFKINNSEIVMNAMFDNKGKYNIGINSDKFEMKNIHQFLNTNLVVPNGREIMSCFKDMKGDFNFNFNMNNDGINGVAGVNQIKTKLCPLADIPLTITKGAIVVNSNDISIKDFKGYYGSYQKQEVAMFGEVNDYMKTAKSFLIITANAYDEFARYISKLAGIKINLINESKIGLKVDFDSTGKVEVRGGGKVPKGSNILFDGASISSDKFDRAVGVNLEIKNQDLKINHVNYYIADEIKIKVKTKPLVTISGLMNAYTGYLKELSFDIPKPLPSEFFNVLVGQRIFRHGTFEGSLKFINSTTPQIDGKMILKGVIVSGQRFLIKNAEIFADKKLIHIISDGSIRRTKYKFNADIANNLTFPIITEKINIDVDEIDAEKVMQTFAPRPANAPARPRPQRTANFEIPKSDVDIKYFEIDENTSNANTKEITDNSDEQIAFQPNLIVIKECLFNVKKGKYKLINFGNLHANLTLTKDGLLEIKSNRFDFADGFSSLRVYCDLLKEKYSIKLGARNVDTDAISTSILNLSKEISGKSSAFLEFNTDKNAKLNGKIKFSIKDGSISKLGLVQYLLNMASIFRNPVAMISPSTLVDLVNVPEGTFKNINGQLEIKNNIIEKMIIKSSSPQLSSFIVGQINLENMDTSLRVYTKFSNQNKGFSGFLRHISFASLSKKLPFSTKEDVSYYAAELSMLPQLEIGEENAQVFLTKIDGDVQTTNFISSLKKIK